MGWIALVFVAGLVLAAAGAGIRVASAPHQTPVGGGGGLSVMLTVY